MKKFFVKSKYYTLQKNSEIKKYYLGKGWTDWSGNRVYCFSACHCCCKHLGVRAAWKTPECFLSNSSKSFNEGWGGGWKKKEDNIYFFIKKSLSNDQFINQLKVNHIN